MWNIVANKCKRFIEIFLKLVIIQSTMTDIFHNLTRPFNLMSKGTGESLNRELEQQWLIGDQWQLNGRSMVFPFFTETYEPMILIISRDIGANWRNYKRVWESTNAVLPVHYIQINRATISHTGAVTLAFDRNIYRYILHRDKQHRFNRVQETVKVDEKLSSRGFDRYDVQWCIYSYKNMNKPYCVKCFNNFFNHLFYLLSAFTYHFTLRNHIVDFLEGWLI